MAAYAVRGGHGRGKERRADALASNTPHKEARIAVSVLEAPYTRRSCVASRTVVVHACLT